MARFDVYLGREGDYLLDCQGECAQRSEHPFCIPLQPLEVAPLRGSSASTPMSTSTVRATRW
jgi:hypothetical protein